MSSQVFCPRCGTANAMGARFCISCGTQLVFIAPPQPPPVQYPSSPQYYQQPQVQYPGPPLYYQQPPPYYAAAVAAQNRMREIDRTKTGLLLLIIGILLTPLPYVQFVGDILILIGAILVIVGRKVFGPTHARNTIWSIIVFVIGIGVLIAGAVAFGLAVASAAFAAVAASNGGAVDPATIVQSLSSAFNILLIFNIAGVGVFGISEVLFTYALQKQTGRILLWAGYVAGVAVAVVAYLVISPLVANAASQSFVGTTYNATPFADLQTQQQVLGLLNYIPATIFASALYLAWSRVRHGELPPQPQPAMGSGPAQAPPSPPPPTAPPPTQPAPAQPAIQPPPVQQ